MNYQIGVSNVKWGEMDAAFAKEPVTSNEFPSKGYYYTTVETLEKSRTPSLHHCARQS